MGSGRNVFCGPRAPPAQLDVPPLRRGGAGRPSEVTLISFPSVCVDLNNPIATVVSARNKAYDELCAAKAAGSPLPAVGRGRASAAHARSGPGLTTSAARWWQG